MEIMLVKSFLTSYIPSFESLFDTKDNEMFKTIIIRKLKYQTKEAIDIIHKNNEKMTFLSILTEGSVLSIRPGNIIYDTNPFEEQIQKIFKKYESILVSNGIKTLEILFEVIARYKSTIEKPYLSFYSI